MSYQPVWYGKGHFSIEDRDYGHTLCSVQFSSDIWDDLTDDEQEKLCQLFAAEIIKTLTEKQDEETA